MREALNTAVGGLLDGFMVFEADADDPPAPPVYALRVTVGGGKSDAALRHLARLLEGMRAAGDGRVFVYAVPYHDLGEELRHRFLRIAGSGLRTAIWRGRESSNPNAIQPGERMCTHIGDVRLAQRLFVSVGEEVCPQCPAFRICAYHEQRHQEADLWFVAHPALFGDVPAAIGEKNIAAIIVDETPWQCGLKEPVEIPLSLLGSGGMPTPSGHGHLGGERLEDIRLRMKQAAEANGHGYITKSALTGAGLCAQSAIDAIDMERWRAIDDGPWRQRESNWTVGPMVMLWEAVRDLMASAEAAIGRITIRTNKDNALVLRVSGRRSIAEDWMKPTLLIDASLEPTLLRVFWPDLIVAGGYEIETPHMRVHQTEGRAFAKSMLAPFDSEPTSDDGRKKSLSRADARRAIRAFILKIHRGNGGRALVISNLKIIEALDLPSSIATAHFNALAGLDDFGDVRTLFVLGRPQPRPEAVEEMAAALTGAAVEQLSDWYPSVDAFRYQKTNEGILSILGDTVRHPDETAELIRRRICEGEVLQAIGRGRGVNRTPETPLDVYILSDVTLDLTIDVFLDGDEVLRPSPTDLMLAEGSVAFRDSACAFRCYPELWTSAEAAKKAIQRARWGTLTKEEYILRKCPPPPAGCRAITFQLAGPGQRPQVAFFDPRQVNDAKSWLEKKFGPLACFEVVVEISDDHSGAEATEAQQPAAVGQFEESVSRHQARDQADYTNNRTFCLERLACLHLDAPIPLSGEESGREMLAAYRDFVRDVTQTEVPFAFRDAWNDINAQWETVVRAAADKLWERKNPQQAKARLRRAMAIFDAHADLQINCSGHIVTDDERIMAAGDSCRLVREFATEAIEQGWPVERLYGTPDGPSGGGLVYFLKGEGIDDFVSDMVVTASGRIFRIC